jgi:hypothetical protein
MLAVSHSKDCGGMGATVFLREAQEVAASKRTSNAIFDKTFTLGFLSIFVPKRGGKNSKKLKCSPQV